jgi:hypothetical protein
VNFEISDIDVMPYAVHDQSSNKVFVLNCYVAKEVLKIKITTRYLLSGHFSTSLIIEQNLLKDKH